MAKATGVGGVFQAPPRGPQPLPAWREAARHSAGCRRLAALCRAGIEPEAGARYISR